MSLKVVSEVRRRIDQIWDECLRNCFRFIFLRGARVGEAVGLHYESETKAHPTGMHLEVRKDLYRPNLLNTNEVQTLQMKTLMVEGRYPDLKELRKVNEPVVILKTILEKRKGNITNETALPMDAKYDPWVQIVYEYIEERQNQEEPVFPFYRQQLWPKARELFEGLEYHVGVYNTPEIDDEGNIVRKEMENGKTRIVFKTVPEHKKPLANHGLRHWRTINLDENYNIKGPLLDLFMGWVGGLGTQKVYRHRPRMWTAYVPNLLMPEQYFREMGAL